MYWYYEVLEGHYFSAILEVGGNCSSSMSVEKYGAECLPQNNRRKATCPGLMASQSKHDSTVSKNLTYTEIDQHCLSTHDMELETPPFEESYSLTWWYASSAWRVILSARLWDPFVQTNSYLTSGICCGERAWHDYLLYHSWIHLHHRTSQHQTVDLLHPIKHLHLLRFCQYLLHSILPPPPPPLACASCFWEWEKWQIIVSAQQHLPWQWWSTKLSQSTFINSPGAPLAPWTVSGLVLLRLGSNGSGSFGFHVHRNHLLALSAWSAGRLLLWLPCGVVHSDDWSINSW